MKEKVAVDQEFTNYPKSDAKLLLLFSSGRDSTAVLKLLLESTINEIYVYHASHKTHNHKYEAEDQAANNVLEYFRQHNRPVTNYSSSIIDQTGWNYYETFNALTDVAAPLVEKYKCGYVASGRKKIGSFTTRPELFQQQHEYQRKVGVPWIYPVWKWTDQQNADYLGNELCSLTWSCGIPVKTSSGWVACGRCEPCMSIKDVTYPG